MRTRAKVDANQKQIVDDLRNLGLSVRHTHKIGQGFPDIAVGYKGRTYLIEIKDGSKPPSARRLTEPEQRFMDMWDGHASVAHCLEDVLQEIGYEVKK